MSRYLGKMGKSALFPLLNLWSHVRVDYSNKKQKLDFEKNTIKLSGIVAFCWSNNQKIRRRNEQVI
jgi:hypothetical protein